MRCDGSFYWLGNRVRYQTKPTSCNSSDVVDYILSDDKFKILCQSALHLAVARNHTKVAKLLLSQEEKTVHCTDFTGRTPLHEAVRQNHVEMADVLIQSGARISQKCRLFQNLSFSDNRTVKKCEKKYDFLSISEEVEYNNDLCHCGSTPFLLAARYGHTEVGSLLLRYGAKSHDKDCQGATPLHVAACHGHYSFIRWLISQRPSLQVNSRSENQSTPLHSGAICKINKAIKPLIDMGASIYDTDQYGMTPLHYSVLNAFENIAVVLAAPRRLTILTCLKLLEITDSTDESYINTVDKNGRTALHLAAQNGEESCVVYLLQKGARTDVTDNKGKTPLDVATEFAPGVLNPTFFEKDSSAYDMDNFHLVLALNQRYHNAIADILLSREAYLTQTCDERQTYQLHRAFEKKQPVIAYQILSKGGSLSCKDAQGRTPLLMYLQNGGMWLDVVLKRFDVTIRIECGKPFNNSEFHLIAFRKPTVPSDNLLEDYTSIKAHPLGFRVIDECRDAEGYTALHRAAQGGRKIAESAADLLLRATRRITRFDIGCNSSQAQLTIYHLSAYRGLSGFVKTVLKDASLLGVDVNCSNLHGITPLYLAKLYVGAEKPSNGKQDQWQEIVDLIEEYGGVLTYPNREVELNVIYRHLFGHHSNPFTLDEEEEAGGNSFYKSGVSACREDDLNYYQTGAHINPYMKAVYSELMRITAPLSVEKTNFNLVPRDLKVLQETLRIRLVALKALKDVSRLFKDISKGMQQTKMTLKRRHSSINASTVCSIKFPKLLERPSITQELQRIMKQQNEQEQSLRETRFTRESSKVIISHRNEHLKNILHRHSEVFGDITKITQLLEKYEGSELCLEEIFQAKLIKLKFHIYVSRSRTEDLISLLSHYLEKAEFLSKRVPSEWLISTEGAYAWNQAVKFLYQQATQRDLAFDYLQDLSLGRDKDTRIPLSEDALFSLSLELETNCAIQKRPDLFKHLQKLQAIPEEITVLDAM
ncbi:Transient receptor putative cation channel sub A member 1 [Desmophyllum pertusum]|uniref:Transient receptor putative cation channel sub A member 1 n=1 Tax=Desmophyllum pertusum TaxID=174260 RepID=A0A9W9YWZ1_9CNID|nr:Transient receptor putative cation channel sub A member 1 [Desmophyllum pertusum]